MVYEKSLREYSLEELSEELIYFRVGCGKKTRYKGNCFYTFKREGKILKVYCDSCKYKIKLIKNEIKKRKND